MRLVRSPLAFWDGFDQETATIAATLEKQLLSPRAQRRGVPKLLRAFERQHLVFRNKLSLMDRSYRRAGGAEGTGGAEVGELRFLRLLRRRLHAMKAVIDTMAFVHKGVARPLYIPPAPICDARHTQKAALDSTMYWLHRMMNASPQSGDADELGCYADIPLRASLFTAHAHAAFRVAMAQKRKAPLRFVDVGCGGGMRVLQASDFFDQVEGYDFDKRYVAAGQASMVQMQAVRCNIYEDNALTFEAYPNYDIIYFYQPMSDFGGLEALEDRIVKFARPGTILIAPYAKFLQRAAGLKCGRVQEAVYVTDTTQAEADALRREAERVGPQVMHPDNSFRHHGVGWLAALSNACNRNGYIVP